MLVSNIFEDRDSTNMRGYKVDALITKLAMNQHRNIVNENEVIDIEENGESLT